MSARQELIGVLVERAAEYEPRAMLIIWWATTVIVANEPELYEGLMEILKKYEDKKT